MRALRVILVVATVTFAISRVPSIGGSLPLAVTAALNLTVYIAATALLALRTLLVRKRRAAWAMLTTALACYTAATSYSWAVMGLGGILAFPSVADVGWLLLYPFTFVALALFIREQVLRSRVNVSRLLADAMVAGLGASALLSAVAIDLLIHPSASNASVLETITAFAYPTGDALLLGMALALFMVVGHAGRRDLGLLISGLVAVTVADIGYVSLASRDLFHPGHLIDLAYLGGLTLVGLSAWGHRHRPVVSASSKAPLVLPIVFGLSSLALLLVAPFAPMTAIPIALAGATLLVVVLHLLGSFREIRNLGLHDPLTGLPNRALIMDRIERLLVRSRRNGTDGAVLYLDLDGFKHINDTYGHDAGDHLLRGVARRLSEVLREADTVGRMGGDEFIVLLEGGSQQESPRLVAERLLDAMRHPFELDHAQRLLMVTASIGIAVGDRHSPDALLQDADEALYRAKASGKNGCSVFSPQMGTEADTERELAIHLDSALDNEQFRLLYMPTYTLGDLSVVGVEALLRWDHPNLGVIQPDEFIPLLEASGHIVEVGRWVLLESCRQMRSWHDQGSEMTMSVNVSWRQLDDDSIIDHVAEALAASGLDPAHLTLEVAEATLMKDAEMSARRLVSLRSLGVRIAIDDFGTGYASLACLPSFPVDCLKIDRSFVHVIARSPESDAVIRALVTLGEAFGLEMLAEGVETADQVDHLRAEGVDEAQGVLLSRPLTPTCLEDTAKAP